MGIIGRFEKGLDRAVNGVFAKAFRSEVQPVEIASALRRECDDKAAIVTRDRTIAPNTFVVELGQADHERLGGDAGPDLRGGADPEASSDIGVVVARDFVAAVPVQASAVRPDSRRNRRST